MNAMARVVTLADRRTRTSAPATIRRCSQVARENGSPIPKLCISKASPTYGGCRLCLVEVEGVNKLLPACATNVTEGMKVPPHRRGCKVSQDDHRNALRRAQPHVRRLRLERPLRAAVAGAESGRRPYPLSLYLSEAAGRRQPRRASCVDHNRCILCTRCVRVCDEIEGAHTWDVMGRGANCLVITDLAATLGRIAELHQLRQMRAGLSHRRAQRERASPWRK